MYENENHFRNTVKEVRKKMMRRRHVTVPDQGKWLRIPRSGCAFLYPREKSYEVIRRGSVRERSVKDDPTAIIL